MEKTEFEILTEHTGGYVLKTENLGFNTLVISSICVGNVQDWQMVGRLIQVRKKTGAFGTDTVLVRLMDGSIMSFENQSFQSVNKEYTSFYEDFMSDVELDEPNIEYSIDGREKARGFIVPENMVYRNDKIDELLD